MTPKSEMRQREFTNRYGAGTALLLRLCESLRGSGRVIVADSAFASVKSVCVFIEDPPGSILPRSCEDRTQNVSKKILTDCRDP